MQHAAARPGCPHAEALPRGAIELAAIEELLGLGHDCCGRQDADAAPGAEGGQVSVPADDHIGVPSESLWMAVIRGEHREPGHASLWCGINNGIVREWQ